MSLSLQSNKTILIKAGNPALEEIHTVQLKSPFCDHTFTIPPFKRVCIYIPAEVFTLGIVGRHT